LFTERAQEMQKGSSLFSVGGDGAKEKTITQRTERKSQKLLSPELVRKPGKNAEKSITAEDAEYTEEFGGKAKALADGKGLGVFGSRRECMDPSLRSG